LRIRIRCNRNLVSGEGSKRRTRSGKHEAGNTKREKWSQVSEVPVQARPSTLEEFWTWHMEAACRQVDTTLFYSPEGERGPRTVRREAAGRAIPLSWAVPVQVAPRTRGCV
jgi:protein gp37